MNKKIQILHNTTRCLFTSGRRLTHKVANFSWDKVVSLFSSARKRLKMQTAGPGVDGGSGKRAAKAYGRMEDASAFSHHSWVRRTRVAKAYGRILCYSSQHSLGWPLSLPSRRGNPPELTENLELWDLWDLKKPVQLAHGS